jgi:8-oxo-dGTP pyrophosphatase MutT (NUDIX family)
MKLKRAEIRAWTAPPKNAKLVYKGRVFSVYQWKQRLFDGRYVTYEAVWRPATVNIIATVGKKVLMTRERQPGISGWYLGIPGGRADYGETPLQGAKRELLEETGCVSDDWELLSTDRAWPVARWAVCWYLARNCRKVAEQSTHPSEIVEVFSADLGQFLDGMVEIFGNVVCDFAEMKHDRRKRDAFARKAFGARSRG